MSDAEQVFLRLAYDGTDFHGSVRQVDPQGRHRVRTVESELSAALEGVLGRPVPIRFASRTDAGVHARGQLASIPAPPEIPVDGLRRAVDDRLPPDVTVREAFSVPAGFDVRRDNRGKIYRYTLVQPGRRDPFVDRFAWRTKWRLDPAAMSAAARAFEGRHDFAGLRAADCQASTTERTIRRIEVDVRRAGEDAFVDVTVEGDAFLKNMVRILVGTLVEVGRGRFDATRARRALDTKDRRDAGPTAPSRGLVLVEVLWPPEHRRQAT